MTYASYRRFLIIFFAIFTPLILLGNELSTIAERSFFWHVIFYAKPILSITLLYFSIYALISGVQATRKGNRPITFIIAGAIFVLMSFGPPVATFFLIHDKKADTLSATQLQALKETAIDMNQKPDERLASAQLYYVITENAIEYLDKSGAKTLYLPSEFDKTQREKHIQFAQEIGSRISLVKAHVTVLLSIAIVSAFGFIAFLRYKFKR